MIKPLMHDPAFLALLSEPATLADLSIASDLLDTLKAHKDGCVGMAANMIGECKRIIAVDDNGNYLVLFNPEILKKSYRYETNEGCLSLLGEPRPVTRYRNIKVRYQNEKMQVRIKNFTEFTAQIIQHEVDHCNGVLI